MAIVIPAFLVPGGEAEIVAEDSLVALQSEIHEAQAAARAERAAQEAEQAAKVERVTPKEGPARDRPARPTAEEPSCHSFDPATPVLMADGSHKAIKDVKVGDKVLTTDPTTGKTVIEKVTALHDNHDADLADITVVDASGKTTVLHTTWHHPFYNADTHTFTDAADLTPSSSTTAVVASMLVVHPVPVRARGRLDGGWTPSNIRIARSMPLSRAVKG